MKRLILVALLSASAQAQVLPPVVYTNQYGQPIGYATTINGVTIYSNQYGQPIGYGQQAPRPLVVAPVPSTPQLTLPPLPRLPPLPPLPSLK